MSRVEATNPTCDVQQCLPEWPVHTSLQTSLKLRSNQAFLGGLRQWYLCCIRHILLSAQDLRKYFFNSYVFRTSRADALLTIRGPGVRHVQFSPLVEHAQSRIISKILQLYSQRFPGEDRTSTLVGSSTHHLHVRGCLSQFGLLFFKAVCVLGSQ
eukprot:6475318-Amphidinium_carterae.2